MFRGIVYKQIQGCAMGSPLSAVVCNLLLEDLEYDLLSNFQQDINFYCRYVDDIFCLIEEDQIENVLDSLNSHSTRLQFKKEKI